MQIEGRNAVKEALDANLTINKVMVDKNLRDRKDPLLFLLTKSRIKIEYLPKNVLDKSRQLLIIKALLPSVLTLLIQLRKLFLLRQKKEERMLLSFCLTA